MSVLLDDYIDADVAYLAGLIVGRGTLSHTGGVRQLVIQFSHRSLEVKGTGSPFSLDDAMAIGLDSIRERLQELLETDIRKVVTNQGAELVARFMRNNMIWRNLLLLTEEATSYRHFHVPKVMFDADLPKEWKREFLRGYADVAGNIRHANRYVDGRHRVRLDVLNYPATWEVPVQLCTLLQDHLDVPVQLITWGHPNMGRGFREHQLNVFAEPFLAIGFSLGYKQRMLEEFADLDRADQGEIESAPCPGLRERTTRKDTDEGEGNDSKLDQRLLGRHFDAYWQICQALGCTRTRRSPGHDCAKSSDSAESGQQDQ